MVAGKMSDSMDGSLQPLRNNKRLHLIFTYFVYIPAFYSPVFFVLDHTIILPSDEI